MYILYLTCEIKATAAIRRLHTRAERYVATHCRELHGQWCDMACNKIGMLHMKRLMRKPDALSKKRGQPSSWLKRCLVQCRRYRRRLPWQLCPLQHVWQVTSTQSLKRGTKAINSAACELPCPVEAGGGGVQGGHSKMKKIKKQSGEPGNCKTGWLFYPYDRSSVNVFRWSITILTEYLDDIRNHIMN